MTNPPDTKPKWKEVLFKAWSVRVLMLAGVVEIATIVLPNLAGLIPEVTFSLIQFGLLFTVLVLRLLPQRNLPDA